MADDPAPANPSSGCYAGDFHVSARHSNPGDATMREAFSYAFCRDPAIDPALCGAGDDVVEAGPNDRLRGCETVV